MLSFGSLVASKMAAVKGNFGYGCGKNMESVVRLVCV